MPIQDTLTDAAAKALNATHRAVLKASGGRFGTRLMGMTALELHTTGRKSGQRRTVMLTAPICEDDRVVLVASKGGDDRHPDWYRNLSAHPDIEVTIAGQTRQLRARTASPEEKAELWPQILSVYRFYDSYQRRTDRDIPVVICEPRSG